MRSIFRKKACLSAKTLCFILIAFLPTFVYAQCGEHLTLSEWKNDVSNSPTSNSTEVKYGYWYCNFRRYSGATGNSRDLKFPFTYRENDQLYYIRNYSSSSLALMKETTSSGQPAFDPYKLEEEANYAARSLLKIPTTSQIRELNRDRYDTLFRVINTMSQIHQRRLGATTSIDKNELVRIREFYDVVGWGCIFQSKLLENFSKKFELHYKFDSVMIQRRIAEFNLTPMFPSSLSKCDDNLTQVLI